MKIANLVRTVAATALVLTVAAIAPARAGVVFSIQELGETSPGSGVRALEVLVANDGADELRINAFSFALSATDVTFLRTTVDTVTAPYIFAGHSFFYPDFGDLGFYGVDGAYRALDLYDDVDGFAVLGAGESLSLGYVTFEAASPNYAIRLLPAPDTEVTFVPFTPAVPEPSTLVLGLAALAVAGLPALRRRSSARG